MNKLVIVALALVYSGSFFAWADEAKGDPGDFTVLSHPDDPQWLTLRDGQASVTINSFGQAGHSAPGCANIGNGLRMGESNSVLCNHTDFLSTGAEARPINSQNCHVVTSITQTQITPARAYSTVMCGPCMINIHHTLDGAQTFKWYTDVSLINCPRGCYYSYTDFDVHGVGNNAGSWNVEDEWSLGGFIVRNNIINPQMKYLFSDEGNASSFVHGGFTGVRDAIGGFGQCTPFDGSLKRFDGDWAGALYFVINGLSTEDDPITIRYSHGRNDTLPFP